VYITIIAPLLHPLDHRVFVLDYFSDIVLPIVLFISWDILDVDVDADADVDVDIVLFCFVLLRVDDSL